jgi:hypothetical protein
MSTEPRLIRVRKHVSTSWKGVITTVIVAALGAIGGWVAGQLTYGLIVAVVVAVVAALVLSRAHTDKTEIVQTFGMSSTIDLVLKKPEVTADWGIDVYVRRDKEDS